MSRFLFCSAIVAIFSGANSQACGNVDLPKGCFCEFFTVDGDSITCRGLTSSLQVLEALKSAPTCVDFKLTNSEIPSLPIGIGPHRLQYLSFVDSKVPYLSPPNQPESAFEGLNNLKRIKFENVDISEYDWTKLQNLPRLDTIFVDGGRFVSIPKEFSSAGNANLETVVLSHCAIDSIQDGALAFPNAKFIQIGDSQIREIRAEMFHSESKIERLVIYDVPITFLPEDVFRGMKNLKSFFTDKSILSFISAKHLDHVQLDEIGFYPGKDSRKPKCDCKYSWVLRHKAQYIYECDAGNGDEKDFHDFLESC